MNIFDLSARIKLDSKEYEDGIGKARTGMGSLSAWTVAKGQIIAGAITEGAKALVGFGKAAVGGYAEAEQLVGGVETLFGAGGKSAEEYAASVGKSVDSVRGEYDKLMQSQSIVMENAKSAYKTAGMSATEYMETVTGFSASLLQSLGGDTEKAANLADVALTDMSDNINKFGGSIESVKFAYSGFSKGNFTMLDNLRLGYSGTKAEMERLLKDAEKLSGQKFDLSSYADVISAIHIIQEEMGIAGTTQQEAATTISGSLGMVKGAWENLVSGLADPNADIGTLVSNMVESVGVASKNLIPAVGQAVKGFGQAISEIGSMLTEDYAIDHLIQDAFGLGLKILDGLQAGVDSSGSGVIFTILESLAIWTEEYADVFAEKSIHLIGSFVNKAAEAFPKLLGLGIDTVNLLADGIVEGIPGFLSSVPKVVKNFIDAVSGQFPKIIGVGFDLLGKFAFGVIEGIPGFVAGLPSVISAFSNFFTNNFPVFIRKGGELLGKLIVGILGAIPQIALNIPDVIKALVKAFEAGYAELKKAGDYLIEGLWEGIGDKVEWLKGKVKGVVNTIKSWFTGKDGFDEHSPSKWSEQVFRYVMDGGGNGIDAGTAPLLRKVGRSVDQVKSHMDYGAVSIPYSQTAMGQHTAAMADTIMAAAPSGGGGVYHIHVNVDGHEMAETIFDPLRGVVGQRGYGLA